MDPVPKGGIIHALVDASHGGLHRAMCSRARSGASDRDGTMLRGFTAVAGLHSSTSSSPSLIDNLQWIFP
jgi:hypothetical protein